MSEILATFFATLNLGFILGAIVAWRNKVGFGIMIMMALTGAVSIIITDAQGGSASLETWNILAACLGWAIGAPIGQFGYWGFVEE